MVSRKRRTRCNLITVSDDDVRSTAFILDARRDTASMSRRRCDLVSLFSGKELLSLNAIIPKESANGCYKSMKGPFIFRINFSSEGRPRRPLIERTALHISLYTKYKSPSKGRETEEQTQRHQH